MPLSLLNDLLYCERRAALKVVEGFRSANQHTNRGDIVHEHADLAGYEVVKGTTLLRALPVWSERLGLNGKCDIVEQRADGSLYPVEFKLGKRRQWENDDAQLCAQALCLEEMLGVAISRGAIFHADSKRRREVEFTPDLRAKTEAAIRALHALSASTGERFHGPPKVAISAPEPEGDAPLTPSLSPPPRRGEGARRAGEGWSDDPGVMGGEGKRGRAPRLPPAVYKDACEECSLYSTCLPKATGDGSRAARLAKQLFQT